MSKVLARCLQAFFEGMNEPGERGIVALAPASHRFASEAEARRESRGVRTW